MVKCGNCGKELESDKAFFEKGKFFCNKECFDAAKKKSEDNKKDNVCEFC